MTYTFLALIKYFFLCFNSIVSLRKICGARFLKKDLLHNFVFSLIVGGSSSFLSVYYKSIIPVIVLAVLIIYASSIYKNVLFNAINYSIIALAISFIMALLSVIILYPISCLLVALGVGENISSIVYGMAVPVMQTIINGILVIKNKFYKYLISVEKSNDDTVLILSIFVLIAASLLNMGTKYSKTVSILVVATFSSGLLLVFGIKKHISYVYAKRVNMRNEEILQSTVKKLEQDIYYLKKDNEKMSAVIHRDNKILPTMQNAVKKVVEKHADDNQKELLATLKKLYAERTALLDDGTDKDFPSTGDLQVDSAVAYLSQKAQSVGVDFFFFFTGDPIVYPDGRGVEDDFLTLLLDLGENAIISAKNADMKLVKMGICFRHGDLSLNVYDSGNKFDERVKRSIGKRRFTTHKTDGGSGIGLMTAYELLRKYSASFVVNENIVSDEFQKCVSVVFNDTFAVRFE